MIAFYKLLTDRGRVNWFLLCQQHDVVLSERDERGVRIETKMENLEEIKDIMEEAPPYTITTNGRRGG